MGRKNFKYRKLTVALIFIFFSLLLVPADVRAGQEAASDKIYDSLNEKVKNDFFEGLDSVEEQKESSIEVSGNLMERIIRTIADRLYRNIDEIKAASLLAGTLSFLGGLVVFKVVRLNKGLKRYALSVFMITIPLVLFLFVIAVSLFIDIFIS